MKGGVYRILTVQTGISDGVNIEIKSGLKANESIRGLKKEM